MVIGNGMAGCRAVEELLTRDAARYRVTIFGAEPRVNYNRIMLLPVLAGEKSFAEIVINGQDWYDEHGIALIVGDPVAAVDRTRKTVTTRSGLTTGNDRLLIATGSDPFIIPVPSKDLPGVIGFRDMNDVETMLEAARNGGAAVVIGGGLLGLDAAHGLSLRGMKVIVIHLMPTLMERQLDEAAGRRMSSRACSTMPRFALGLPAGSSIRNCSRRPIPGPSAPKGQSLRAARPLPAQARAAVAGDCPRRRGRLPAPQLADFAEFG